MLRKCGGDCDEKREDDASGKEFGPGHSAASEGWGVSLGLESMTPP